VVRAYSLRGGEAEALEAIVHGDPKSSKIVGRRIGELALPPDATVAAIVRGRDVLIARDDLVVEAEDHLILLLSDKRQLRALERLLQVSVHFL
jgi:trk system potassium uptake protein TrkA